ncbi:MAG: helix-turn-helix transcriptional regulator [Phycisphaerae bacterium]|nr:helix-turn-helix transcriptional regulator [Phycisphaerae bacterium]
MAVSKELVAASATPLVLSILSEGDSYGYAIIKRVRDLSQNGMQWTDGMLYPVLHRLEGQDLIESYEEASPSGRRRRYYRIKDHGKHVLAEQKSQWTLVHATLTRLWEARPCLT